jgi:hypothetical protein
VGDSAGMVGAWDLATVAETGHKAGIGARMQKVRGMEGFIGAVGDLVAGVESASPLLSVRLVSLHLNLCFPSHLWLFQQPLE